MHSHIDAVYVIIVAQLYRLECTMALSAGEESRNYDYISTCRSIVMRTGLATPKGIVGRPFEVTR